MTIKRWSEVSNSRFIAADEFEGRDITLTIKDILLEDMTDYDGEPSKAGVVSFIETDRQWRLNSTNRQRLATIWPKPAQTIGRRVTLMAAPESKSPSGVAVRVKGSPDLDGPTKTLDPIGLGKTRAFTLVRTEDKVTPAPEPKAEEDSIDPDEGPDAQSMAVCTECGMTAMLSPDATPDDVAEMFCSGCGAQTMKVDAS